MQESSLENSIKLNEKRKGFDLDRDIVAYLCVYSSVEAVDDAASEKEAVEVQPIEIEMRKYPIRAGNATIGRGDDQTVPLGNLFGVSANHCILQVSEDGLMHWLMDQGSTNGTFINRHRLTPQYFYQLKHSDSITFAATKAVYLYSPHILETLNSENHLSSLPVFSSQTVKDASVLSQTNEAPLSNRSVGSNKKPTLCASDIPNRIHASDETVSSDDEYSIPGVSEAIEKVASVSPAKVAARVKESFTRTSSPQAAPESPERVHADSVSNNEASNSKAAPVVMFTHMSNTGELEQLVRELGGQTTDDWRECTHLVTDRVRRTVKFMCAAATGAEIVSEKWLTSSKMAGEWNSCKPYRIKDRKAEAAFRFTLDKVIDSHPRDSLNRFIREEGVLAGFKVYVSPGVMPPPKEMGKIIEAAGGEYLESPPSVAELSDPDGKAIIFGDHEDTESQLKPYLKDRRAQQKVYQTELIMSGILQCSLDFSLYQLKKSKKRKL